MTRTKNTVVEETEVVETAPESEAPVEETVEEETPVVEAEEVSDTAPSSERAKLLEVIEIYKTQNPAKYELKKEALLEQLKTLK